MFYGSDTHAEAAAALFSVIASCRLHRLDPERYLDEVFRLLPYWPDDRYLELAPHRWSTTLASTQPNSIAHSTHSQLPRCEGRAPLPPGRPDGGGAADTEHIV